MSTLSMRCVELCLCLNDVCSVASAPSRRVQVGHSTGTTEATNDSRRVHPSPEAVVALVVVDGYNEDVVYVSAASVVLVVSAGSGAAASGCRRLSLPVVSCSLKSMRAIADSLCQRWFVATTMAVPPWPRQLAFAADQTASWTIASPKRSAVFNLITIG